MFFIEVKKKFFNLNFIFYLLDESQYNLFHKFSVKNVNFSLYNENKLNVLLNSVSFTHETLFNQTFNLIKFSTSKSFFAIAVKFKKIK